MRLGLLGIRAEPERAQRAEIVGKPRLDELEHTLRAIEAVEDGSATSVVERWAAAAG